MAHGLTLVLAALIAALTLTPAPPGPPGVPGLDKLAHVVAFAALAGPLSWRYPKWWWAVALVAVAYGGVIELVQPSVGRSMEGADLVADGAGAVLGAWTSARLGVAWRGRSRT